MSHWSLTRQAARYVAYVTPVTHTAGGVQCVNLGVKCAYLKQARQKFELLKWEIILEISKFRNCGTEIQMKYEI
jgi:hypothetical protein